MHHAHPVNLAELVDAENARLFDRTEAALDALDIADRIDRLADGIEAAAAGLTITGTCDRCGIPWTYSADGSADPTGCIGHGEDAF